jgi:hypothetical protein
MFDTQGWRMAAHLWAAGPDPREPIRDDRRGRGRDQAGAHKYGTHPPGIARG